MTGIDLTPGREHDAEVAALVERCGGRVGVVGVLQDLSRRARRARVPGRAVREALTWERADRRDRRWWPQGVSSSAEAGASEGIETVAGRRVLLTSWYERRRPGDPEGYVPGSRLSVLDLDTRRYEHVLLVVPALRDGIATVEPVRVHAGGVVWAGPWVHVAATGKGFVSARLEDLVRSPAGGTLDCRGHRYLLPVRLWHRGSAPKGTGRLRWSFFCLDPTTSPPALVVGEYGRGAQSTRLARFPLNPATWLPSPDADGVSRPSWVAETGLGHLQGVVVARGHHLLSASRGPWLPGTSYAGEPGRWRRFRWTMPMGPEDLTYWASQDRLWSVSEHPWRRWVFAMDRSWFDR